MDLAPPGCHAPLPSCPPGQLLRARRAEDCWPVSRNRGAARKASAFPPCPRPNRRQHQAPRATTTLPLGRPAGNAATVRSRLRPSRFDHPGTRRHSRKVRWQTRAITCPAETVASVSSQSRMALPLGKKTPPASASASPRLSSSPSKRRPSDSTGNGTRSALPSARMSSARQHEVQP